MKQIILASTSPRRTDLLNQIGLSFQSVVPKYQEDMSLDLIPEELVKYLATKKVQSIAEEYTNSIIIGADTIVVQGNKVTGKPEDKDDAVRILFGLSGHTHSVLTGFCVYDTESHKLVSKSVETILHFRKISLAEIKAYVETGEPLDKAGAYALSGYAAIFCEKIEGEYSNVIGLPLFTLSQALKDFGVDTLNLKSETDKKLNFIG